MLTKEELPACPVAATVQIIGSKLGQPMQPIIDSMAAWGLNYQKIVRNAD